MKKYIFILMIFSANFVFSFEALDIVKISKILSDSTVSDSILIANFSKKYNLKKLWVNPRLDKIFFVNSSNFTGSIYFDSKNFIILEQKWISCTIKFRSFSFYKEAHDFILNRYVFAGSVEIRQTYFDNGQISVEAHYRNGKLHGLYSEFDQEGQIIEKIVYRSGRKSSFLSAGSPQKI